MTSAPSVERAGDALSVLAAIVYGLALFAAADAIFHWRDVHLFVVIGLIAAMFPIITAMHYQRIARLLRLAAEKSPEQMRRHRIILLSTGAILVLGVEVVRIGPLFLR